MKVRKFYREERRNAPWGASWFVDGKRKAKFFETQEERDDFALNLKDAAKENGLAYLKLDARRHMAWLRADEILAGVDPVAAAEFYVKHHRPLTDTVLADARGAFLKERAGRGYQSGYVAHLRRHLEEFEAELQRAGQHWQTVASSFIREWVYGLPYVPETKGTYLKSLRTFYAFCVDEKIAAENPARAVKPPKVVRGEVAFVPADDMAKLFAAAWEHDRELCGLLALGAFAGMRSSAILRLEAGDLRWEQKGILMPAEKTKTARRQFVQGFPPNLWAWLKACPPVHIPQRPWDDRRAAVALRANVALPHNALRHSFATHHVALHGNAEKTATLLTHRGVGMLWQHYKGNATKADARRYFQILPPG